MDASGFARALVVGVGLVVIAVLLAVAFLADDEPLEEREAEDAVDAAEAEGEKVDARELPTRPELVDPPDDRDPLL